MSDTPLTDREAAFGDEPECEWVPADFVRELERVARKMAEALRQVDAEEHIEHSAVSDALAAWQDLEGRK